MLTALALLAAIQAEPATEPQPLNRDEWVTHHDYPSEAVRRGEQGAVRFRLHIDREGRPLSCEIVESAGATLDGATCGLLIERARFEPARDAEGAPVEGSYSNVFSWRLDQGSTGLPFRASEFVASMEHGEDGRIACTLINDAGRPEQAPPEGCGFLAAARADRYLRLLDPGARYTLVMRIEPEGERAPRADGAWGEPLFEIRLDLVLAPDGRFERCEETIVVDRGSETMPQVPRPCRLGTGAPAGFFAAAEPDAAPRRGSLAIVLHLRTAPGALRQLPQAEPPLHMLFSQDDYPTDAHRKGEQGTVRFRLDIDPRGRVSRCTVTESSGSASLDTRTCAILRERARFKPGRDDRGRPVASRMTHHATWMLDDGDTMPFLASAGSIAVTAGAQGDCLLTENGETRPPWDAGEIGLCLALAHTGSALRPDAPAGAVITLVNQFTPVGAEPVPPPHAPGMRIWALEAEIEIDGLGRVASCRMVGRDVSEPAVEPYADLCASADTARRLYAPAPGEGPRRAIIRSILYLHALTQA